MAVAAQILHVALTGELRQRSDADLPQSFEALLPAHAAAMDSLYAHVREADPAGFLSVTWEHPMFGDLNWREWLLFLRIHAKDHAQQLRAMQAAAG